MRDDILIPVIFWVIVFGIIFFIVGHAQFPISYSEAQNNIDSTLKDYVNNNFFRVDYISPTRDFREWHVHNYNNKRLIFTCTKNYFYGIICKLNNEINIKVI
jgi:hypothetical protein